MRKMITVREWVKRFDAGTYDAYNFDTQVAAGWYDCFCEESELPGRLRTMGEIIKQITNDYILDNFWVWFKNNCPALGPLYDDMRFEPMDETKREQFYFLVTTGDSRADAKYELITARDKYRCEYSTDEIENLLDQINGLGVQFAEKQHESELAPCVSKENEKIEN